VATSGHPQLLAMGEPVRIRLAGVSGLVTALGPYELTPYLGGTRLPTQTVGIFTLKAAPTTGSITLRAADFLSRDETGHYIALQPIGPSIVTATPRQPAQLKVKGTFESGAAQLTWVYGGKPLTIWDFNIELD
jgi:hypothetical protein